MERAHLIWIEEVTTILSGHELLLKIQVNELLSEQSNEPQCAVKYRWMAPVFYADWKSVLPRYPRFGLPICGFWVFS